MSGKPSSEGLGINRAVYLRPHEDEAIQRIAAERKWSLSQTIAEMVRESPAFVRALLDLNTAEPTETPV